MKQSATAALLLFLTVVMLAGMGQAQSTTAPAQTTENAAAVVNGKSVTQGEVDNAIFAQLFPLQQQIYALRKVALDNLITRALLDEEAKRRGIAIEELKQQLIAGAVEVSTAKVDEVYAENISVFAAMSPEEARLRLRLDLESQARMQKYREALSKLKGAAQIRLLLKEPRLPSVSDMNAPSLGQSQALITIVEFSDFQCPFCRNSQSVIREVLKAYKSDVRFLFKHLPLESHSQAFTSARAAFCAGEQGAFWKYHDALFASEDLSVETLDKLASSLRLDLTKFGSCMKSERSREAVQKDLAEARRFGIDSTPTFVINGRLFRGALSFEDFKAAIDQELHRIGNNSQ